MNWYIAGIAGGFIFVYGYACDTDKLSCRAACMACKKGSLMIAITPVAGS
jgi:hypothetical protein